MTTYACLWCCFGRWVGNSVDQKTSGGFHGTPIITSSHVRLNIQLGNNGRISRSPTVCSVVHTRIVPDRAVSIAVLRRDSW